MAKEENEIQLDFLDGEIKIELSNQTPNDAEEAMPPEEHVGRKPFIIHDFDAPRDREMAVFTRAKKLSEYVFVITEKSPKKLRWSIVARLQNCSVDVIEYLYRANYERDADQFRNRDSFGDGVYSRTRLFVQQPDRGRPFEKRIQKGKARLYDARQLENRQNQPLYLCKG